MAISIFPRVDVTGTNRWGVLRRGHWATQGIVLCHAFGQAAVVSRATAPLIGARSSGLGGAAEGVYFGATSDYATLMSGGTSLKLPTNRATVLVYRRCNDTTARNSSLFGIDTTTNRIGAHVPYGDGTVYWDFGGNGSGANRLTVAASKTTQWETWAFIAGVRGSSIWRNGASLASQATAITRTGVNQDFRLNSGNGVAATGDTQTIAFFAVLDAEWTAPMIREWHSNPWLMFDTPRRYVSEGSAPPAASARAFATFFG